VHAQALAAFRAGPFFHFLGNKKIRSDSLDALQVCDDAYPVPGAVTEVEVKQFSTWITGAGSAELVPAGGEFLAILDGTIKARGCLVFDSSPAAGARVAISNVSAT
jgi:hypothetical protein